MSESFTQFEAVAESAENTEMAEQVLITSLDGKGIEDTETKESLLRYVARCNAEADKEAGLDPGNPIAANRANIKSDVTIAFLYLRTERYKGEGVDMLRSALESASQQDSTADLAEEIGLLLNFVLGEVN